MLLTGPQEPIRLGKSSSHCHGSLLAYGPEEVAQRISLAFDKTSSVDVVVGALGGRESVLTVGTEDTASNSAVPVSTVWFAGSDPESFARFGLCVWVCSNNSLYPERRVIRVAVAGNRTIEALGYAVWGIACALRGAYDEALPCFRKVYAATVDANRTAPGYLLWWLGLVQLSIAQNSGSKSQYESAEGLLRDALRSISECEDEIATVNLLRALGRTYLQRPSAKPFDCCRIALEYLSDAERALDKARFPIEWAHVLYDRASIRLYIPRGRDNQALELARLDIQAALSHFDAIRFPFEYAQCMNAMGQMMLRSAGRRLPELSQAYIHLEKALVVRRKDSLPWHYAQTKHNMGIVLSMMAEAEKEGRNTLLRAIECFREAISVFEKRRYPYRYYQSLSALGRAYAAMGVDDTHSLDLARQCYTEILNSLSPADAPYYYGRALYDLGNLLTLETSPFIDVMSAIKCFEHSLAIFSPEEFPYDRALVLVAMATAMLQARNDVQVEYSQYARDPLGYFTEALDVFKRGKFVYEAACVHACLGSLLLTVSEPVIGELTWRAQWHYRQACTIFSTEGCERERDLMQAYLTSITREKPG